MTPSGGSCWWLMLAALCCLASCEIRSACDYCDCYEDQDGYRAANCTTSAFLAHHRKPASTDIRVLNLRPVHYKHHDHYTLVPKMFHSFKNVEVLDLTNCSVGPSLPDNAFLGLQYVIEIDLSYNKIKDLNGVVFSTLRNLKTLVLRGNYLKTTSRNALVSSSLVELDMGHCRIESIPQGFLKTPSLRRLYLDGNSISSLGYDVLPKDLTYLNLADNNIVNVPVQVLRSFTYLKTLDLTVNPIYCTCSLLLFQDEFSGRGNFFENVTCVYPSRYKGQGINEINEDELCRHESSINHINGPLYPLKVADDRFGKFNAYDQVMGDQPATDENDTTRWLPETESDEKHETTDSQDTGDYYDDERTHDNGTDYEETLSYGNTKESLEEKTSHHETQPSSSENHDSIREETSPSSPIPLLDADDTLPDLANYTSDRADHENLSSSGNTDTESSSEATHGPDFYATDGGSGDGETDTTRSEETTGSDLIPFIASSTTEPTDESRDQTNHTETDAAVRSLSDEEVLTTTLEPEQEGLSSSIDGSSTTEETEIAPSNGTDSTDFEFSEDNTSPDDDNYATTDETSETTTDTPPLLSSSTTEESPLPEETEEAEQETTPSDSTLSGSSTTETTQVSEEEETSTDETQESTTTPLPLEVSSSETSSETTSLLETSGSSSTSTTEEPSLETLEGVDVPGVDEPDLTTSPEPEAEHSTSSAPEETTVEEEVVIKVGAGSPEEGEEGEYTNEEFKRDPKEESKKQSMGSYIVVGLIAVLVLGLILLAVCKKRRHDKKKTANKIRLPHDAESNMGTEMRDMDSLLPKPPENGVKILPKDYGEPPNGEVKEEAQPVLLQEEENVSEVEKPEQNGGVQRATVRLSVLPEPVVQTPVFIHKPYPDD